MIDLFIIFAFVVYSISNGFRNRSKASKNLEEYFLAGRSVKGWRAGFSMAATQFAADTPLLVTGLIATGGIFMLWRLWIYGLGFLMIGFLLGRSWRHARVLTDAELTEIRYSGRIAAFLRGFRAVYLGFVFNVLIMASVTLAAIKFSTVLFGLSPVSTVLIAGGATLVFSMIGGLRGVLLTDFFLFIFAMAGAGAAAYFAVNHPEVGGLAALFDDPVVIASADLAAPFKSLDVFVPLLLVPLAAASVWLYWRLQARDEKDRILEFLQDTLDAYPRVQEK